MHCDCGYCGTVHRKKMQGKIYKPEANTTYVSLPYWVTLAEKILRGGPTGI